jgi:hypothetical protein
MNQSTSPIRGGKPECPDARLDPCVGRFSLVLNEHFEEDGESVFREACRLGCEGIVSKKALSQRRLARLTAPGAHRIGEGQEPESASGDARGGGGLGALRACVRR